MAKEEMRESPSGRSMLKLYAQCPRKWSFKYIKGFKLLDTADHLSYGSAIHEAQAEFYLHDFSVKHAQDKIDEMLTGKPDLLQKAHHSFMVWFQSLGKYDQENCKILEVEKEAYLRLPNGYMMTVRRDRVLEDCLVDEVFINDTKTTGWSLEGTINNYMLNDQPQLYIASAIQEEEEWVDRLSGWRTDCIYSKGKVTKVQRSPVSNFTKEQLDNTVKSYAVMTSDMAYKINAVLLDSDPISSHFFCNNEACLAYNRKCEYFNFCHEVDTMNVPPANFEIDEWLAQGTVLDAFKNVEE